jgi:hypothetical protein
MCECCLPEYEGKRRVYVSLRQKRGQEKACGMTDSAFQAGMELLMPDYGGLDLQPHAEVMAKIAEKKKMLEEMPVGSHLEGICINIECRELDMDEYAMLDLEVLENGF